MDTFRFRLNCIDHYQAVPTDLDPVLRSVAGPSRQNVPHVPVIRIFGATETGQKVCAHIHGALPYLYLEYHGSLDKDSVNSYIRSLRASVDHALAATYRRNPYDGRSVYVGHITLVKGIPFFGYHVGYRFFLKVYLLNPTHMTRFADLLHQGVILNRVFQPYESHMQYLLQWMCDYNLYGCAYIDCAKVQFRGPVPDSDTIDTAVHKWHDASIRSDSIADADQYPRQSHCSIEVDICVQDILNRQELKSRKIHHQFFERSELKTDEKYVPSMAGLWRDETIRRKRRMGLTDPSSSPFPPEVFGSMSADPRNTSKGGWIHEEEYREYIQNLIRDEEKMTPAVDMASFIKPIEGEELVQTAVESVEDLYPTNLASQTIPEDEDEILQGDLPRDFGIVPQDKLDLEDSEIPAEASDEGDVEDQQQLEKGPPLDPLSLSEAHCFQLKDPATPSKHRRGDHGVVVERSDSANGVSTTTTPSRKRTLLIDYNDSAKRHRPLFERGASHKASTHTLQVGERETSIHDDDSYVVQSATDNVEFQQQAQSKGSDMVNHQDKSQSTNLSKEASGDLRTTPQQSHPTRKVSNDASPAVSHDHTLQVSWADQHRSTTGSYRSNSESHASAASLVHRLGNATAHPPRTVYYGFLPPLVDSIEDSVKNAGLPAVLYQDAYYSDELDVPERPREYAGREFKLQSTTLPYLPPFDATGTSFAIWATQGAAAFDKTRFSADTQQALGCASRHWELASAPPSFDQVNRWLREESKSSVSKPHKQIPKLSRKHESVVNHLSQVEGPTQKNKYGFKFSQKKAKTSVKHETQYMSILSLEVHANSRGVLVPDPAQDEIQAIFWCIEGEEDAENDHPQVGILCLSDDDGIVNQIRKQAPVAVESEEDELDMINRIIDIVRYFDPDILTGYEVHNSSWGYLIERARLKYEYDLCDEISRMKSQSHGRFGKEADRWGFTHTSTIRVTGRHMINIWRAMRGELNLLQYTMENVVFHLLHKRIPHYQHSDITAWYTSSTPRNLQKVLDYFITRVQLNLDILEANEIVPRTSEQARLLGVDFFSVISRGSQFKVESTMFRIAKPENFILVSPSRKQVGQQNALECLPLVMEPQSAFYSSPVLVLDFQSLYPSIMIAYNYCYSTCLGRVVPWRGRNKLGFSEFSREPRLLELVKEYINIAPNGLMFVRPEMRKSLLAKMLGELIETRVMVKSGMKVDKDDKSLQQLLNNRQLALKMLANVTYGYTSASFSGRMPCSEIADSIVQTARETLEKAIALIHSVEKWGAEVVYGDTDSLFIHLKGRTREQAFTIGEEIVEAVTKANPKPIKLKFEKVYHPCVLLAKKRYVGFKYEHRQQKEPDFDAKGIETVRRDGTPAEQKIEEKALKILFRTSDLSEVKKYFLNQCTKIMEGRVSIQDFLFAKEVKLGTYSDKGPPPAGALIATKRMLMDPRSEPQYGERVPYVVITGAPNARLIDRCVSPDILLQNEHIELDAEYYILKNLIPPLERIFNLVGANIRQWYDDMPKVQRIRNVALPLEQQAQPGDPLAVSDNARAKHTLEGYMKASLCLVCRTKLPSPPSLAGNPNNPVTTYVRLPLCERCLKRPARTLLRLRNMLWKSEKSVAQVDLICRNCSGLSWGEEIRCDSRDCPVFYTRVRERARLGGLRDGMGKVVELLEERGEDVGESGESGEDASEDGDENSNSNSDANSGNELDW